VGGKLHRDGNLPAIEYKNGSRKWYKHDLLHRDGGLPAVEYADGGKEWFVNGEEVLPPSCAGEIMEIGGRKYRLVEV